MVQYDRLPELQTAVRLRTGHCTRNQREIPFWSTLFKHYYPSCPFRRLPLDAYLSLRRVCECRSLSFAELQNEPLTLPLESSFQAQTYGGFDAVCGKEIILNNRDLRYPRIDALATRALIVHSCSPKFCPSGLGVGELYTATPPRKDVYGFILPPFYMITPLRPHQAIDYKASWVS